MATPSRFHPAALAMTASIAALTTWGCASIIGADFDKAFEPGTTSSAGGAPTSSASSTGAGGTGGSGGAVDDGGKDAPVETGPPCTVTTLSFKATADTQMAQGSGASITYGSSDIAGVNNNTGGRPILRFDLSMAPPDVEAFASIVAGTVLSMKLTLTHVPMTSAAGACGGPCPHAPGKIHVFPLRNDWIEGKGMAYDGANWFQRGPSLMWFANGADSPMDHGTLAALAPPTGTFMGTEPEITIDLDHAAFTPWLDVNKKQLSLMLVPESIVFIFATKETGFLPQARLDVGYCPGDI